MYRGAIAFADITPSMGKKTNGNRDVTARGTASVSHHTPIQTAAAAALASIGVSGVFGMISQTIRPSTGPRINGISLPSGNFITSPRIDVLDSDENTGLQYSIKNKY